MKIWLKLLLTTTLFVKSAFASVTVKDEMGNFTLDKTPKRIIALEYSYVDALAQVGVSPVGLADDNDPNKLIKQVREKIKPWQSVGRRSAPSLEAIAMLKPDLIIADKFFQGGIYEELKKIAPTVVFNSRLEGYQANLETAQKIADLVGKSRQMKFRIKRHKQTIAKLAKQIKQGIKVVFANSRETKFYLYNNTSFGGGLLETLGFVLPKALKPEQPSVVVGLEQVVAEKPEVMIIAHHRSESIARKWEKEPLWKLIPAVKNNKILEVDNDLWTLSRGMEAAEVMANQVVYFMNQKTKK